jgi:hypothetical protein
MRSSNTQSVSSTPSPPPEGELTTPAPPTPREITVFTEGQTLTLSTSSRATEKLDQLIDGEEEMTVTTLPRLPGARRTRIAMRGPAGKDLGQVSQLNTPLRALLRSLGRALDISST